MKHFHLWPKLPPYDYCWALGVVENFHFWQLDVSNAFPNADLEEEMELDRSKVLKLLKGFFFI